MRNTIEYIYKNTILPFKLIKKFGHIYREVEKELYHNIHLDEGQLTEINRNKLKELLFFTKNNNDYYEGYDFGETVDIEKIIQSLPVLDKKDIVNIPYSNTPSKFIQQHKTSGSTGIPLKISTNEVNESYRRVAFKRFLNWHGLDMVNKNILIWGQMQSDVQKQNRNLKNAFFEKTYFVNVFRLNSEIDNLYRKMLRFKPKFIRSYKSGIIQMCNLMEREGFDPGKLGIDKVITTSEILFPDERNFIEKFLKTKVIDEYGAAETGLIAGECPFQRKHLFTDRFYYYLNKNNELIITDLDNYLTPIINYKIGDRVIIDEDNPCPCGSPFPIIKQIEGRQRDQIVTPDGNNVNSAIIHYIISGLSEGDKVNLIKQYKVVQLDRLTFGFYYVPGKSFREESLKYIEKRMKEEIGSSIEIRFKGVEEIPKEKSGKVRYFKGIES